MKFLMIHRIDEAAMPLAADGTDEEDPAADAELDAWVEEMEASGVKLHGGRLRPVRDARIVRVRAGEVLISDGPFAETKEQIAGFDVLECASMEEAIQIASRHPTTRMGTCELRPFWQ
ncbi:MAG TPA: YciI family protein [Streptosporangiaceae bacterium]|nr:YciI family protein [Streptosporangiaceae bacterium]